jgi:hypothetical protein
MNASFKNQKANLMEIHGFTIHRHPLPCALGDETARDSTIQSAAIENTIPQMKTGRLNSPFRAHQTTEKIKTTTT